MNVKLEFGDNVRTGESLSCEVKKEPQGASSVIGKEPEIPNRQDGIVDSTHQGHRIQPTMIERGEASIQIAVPGSGNVVAGTTVVKPVVHGSIAFFLGKQATEGNSHRWSIFLRGLEDEDLSYFIEKVIFTLHPSCQEPVVVCENPPYEVTQTGWGEFVAKITLVFRNSEHSQVDIFHSLRLYAPGVNASNTNVLMKKPVILEHYEELLFHNPSEEFYKTLTDIPINLRKDVSSQTLRPHFSKISEISCMKQISACQSFVSQEIEVACQTVLALEDELRKLKKV